ncbi:MAG: DUF192 domain-containing protein [Pseudomonadota bacterium]
MPRFLIIVLTLCAFVSACSADHPQRLPVDPAPLQIIGADGAEKAFFEIEVADTGAERGAGLMHRTDLPRDRGMLFVFPDEAERFFWMQNTPSSLDIIYADADGVVGSIAKSTVPFSTQPIPSGFPAKFVLEVLAGVADEVSIAPGDRLSHPLIDK